MYIAIADAITNNLLKPLKKKVRKGLYLFSALPLKRKKEIGKLK